MTWQRKPSVPYKHELGKPDLTFLQFGYMAGKEGLLAGEKLYLDLKRMETTFHELNQREYELTKHVSLLQLNPLALLQLRTTGQCTVLIPEEFFDMDGSGHYFRHIKSVALSIPCVNGPYTSVNCTLRFTKSSIRKEVGVGDGYSATAALKTAASAIISEACKASSPVLRRMIAVCSRPICMTNATYHLKTPA